MDQAKREKSRDYSRGYQAGRNRIEAEHAQYLAIHEQIHSKTVERRDAFFNAALTGLIVKGNWQMDGKNLNNMNEYIELARRFADASMKAMKP